MPVFFIIIMKRQNEIWIEYLYMSVGVMKDCQRLRAKVEGSTRSLNCELTLFELWIDLVAFHGRVPPVQETLVSSGRWLWGGNGSGFDVL
jgi:hypothetical protein